MISSPWPNSKKACFCISVDVDADSPLLWRMRDQRNILYIAELEQRQHGIRYGIDALCELFKKYNINGTFFVPAVVAEKNKSLLNKLISQGHEVGLHGYAHEAVRDISDEEFSAALNRSISVFEKQIGRKPKGFRAPGWEMTYHMLSELKRHHLYDSSLAGSDIPYSIGGIIEVPVSWSREDTSRFKMTGLADRWPPFSPVQVLEEWIFDYEATYERGGLFLLTIHDWISGRPAQLRLLEKLIQRVMKKDDVWFATCEEIAANHAEKEKLGNDH